MGCEHALVPADASSEREDQTEENDERNRGQDHARLVWISEPDGIHEYQPSRYAAGITVGRLGEWDTGDGCRIGTNRVQLLVRGSGPDWLCG